MLCLQADRGTAAIEKRRRHQARAQGRTGDALLGNEQGVEGVVDQGGDGYLVHRLQPDRIDGGTLGSTGRQRRQIDSVAASLGTCGDHSQDGPVPAPIPTGPGP